MRNRVLGRWFAMFLVVSITTPMAVAQGQRVDFDVAGFSQLSLSGQLDVTIIIDPDFAAFAQGEPRVLDAIEVAQDGPQLRIHLPQENLFSSSPDWQAQVVIGLPSLADIKASRGSVVRLRGELSTGNLAASVSTGAVLTLAGSCDRLEVEASTGAVFDADRLICRRVEVSAHTGAVADVHATDRVEASATLGAVVTVAGDPPRTEVSASLGAVVNGT